MNGCPISVVLPVLNGARFLGGALDSVLADLAPTDEVVVVDGGSADGSVQIAEGRRQVQCVRQTGEGLANAWNEGIAAAAGDLIAFMESDDIWMPGRAAAQRAALARNADADGVFGAVRFFLEPGASVPLGFRHGLLDGPVVARIPGTLLARKEAVLRAGAFDPALRIAADVDWFARAAAARVRFVEMDALVLRKRVHGGNLSLRAAENTRELLAAMRRAVAMRREGGL